MLVFLPLAHVLARAITIAAFANKVTLGFTSDIKNLVPLFGVFKPTLVVSVPRVFEKVYNTAEQNARSDGKGRFRHRRQHRDRRAKPGHRRAGLLLRAKHAVFDRLVYGKLRAALGGDCRASISGGAPLGARLGHFYRGVGLTIYEGYGPTETSAAITVSPVDDLKIGTVGKLLPGNSMRINDDDELLVRGGVVFSGYWHNEGRPRRCSPTAGSTPATSARSTMTASCPSSAARRRSSSPPAARTSPPPPWRINCGPIR